MSIFAPNQTVSIQRFFNAWETSINNSKLKQYGNY